MNWKSAKCFSFYSYKGGSGRTTTLLNTTKHLCEKLKVSKEKPILLIDADLESAGLTYFFNCETRFSAKFNSTIHAEAFLNRPQEILDGFGGSLVFGKSPERLFSCESIAIRIDKLYPGYNVVDVLNNVFIRETTSQIFDRIVSSAEKCQQDKKSGSVPDKEARFLSKTYDLDKLVTKLINIDKSKIDNATSEKRKTIEAFLPTDGMVDVSEYFGLSEGSVKFIGVDVAYTGKHTEIDQDRILANKNSIVSACTKNGFSAILFDCGAGVQSTAHVLNHISDVLVYCMRPTYQFISGTRNQLINYIDCLSANAVTKQRKAAHYGEPCDKKTVIMLPTAVPYTSDGTSELQKDSFDRIRGISQTYSEFVDNTFCSYNMALKEVALFKWREHILGAKAVETSQTSAESLEKLNVYSDYQNMPKDAKSAYDTYSLLADRLVYNA